MAEKFYYANEDGTEYRAPRWWLGYLAGSLMVVLGLVVPCAGLIVMGISSQSPIGTLMTPPGKMTVQITETGEQVIWVDEPDGDSLMGVDVDVPSDFVATVTSPNGSDVPTRAGLADLTGTTMHTSRTGAATFNADFKGGYIVEVKGTFKPNQKIAVTTDPSTRNTALGLGVILLFLLALLVVVGGITTLIITGVRHSRAGKVAV